MCQYDCLIGQERAPSPGCPYCDLDTQGLDWDWDHHDYHTLVKHFDLLAKESMFYAEDDEEWLEALRSRKQRLQRKLGL